MPIFSTSNVAGGYDSNHIYYNISIVNNDTTGTKKPPQVIFNEIRNGPYLNNPNDYFMSVVRFSLETPSLPSFIPQVLLGQADPDKLIYTVTLSYDVSGVTYNAQENVMYEPQDKSQPVPNNPLVLQDVTSEYYYVYSFKYWMDLVNNTLATAYNSLNTLVTGAGGTLPSSYPPFMTFDNFLYTMNADISGYTVDINGNGAYPSPTDAIKIFFNTPLFTLFSSFNAIYYGYDNIQFGKNYQLLTRYDYKENVSTTLTDLSGASYTVTQLQQEYPSVPLLNPVQAIVFTTALLPVVPELTTVPVVFNSESRLFNVGNNANITNVLTDFEIPLDNGAEYKPNVLYSPGAEYRLVDLFGNTPLSALEVRVFWRDKFGNLNPFKLNSGCTSTIKIMFRKKVFNIPDY